MVASSVSVLVIAQCAKLHQVMQLSISHLPLYKASKDGPFRMKSVSNFCLYFPKNWI